MKSSQLVSHDQQVIMCPTQADTDDIGDARIVGDGLNVEEKPLQANAFVGNRDVEHECKLITFEMD